MNVCQLSVNGIEEHGEYESQFFDGKWLTNAQMLDRAKRTAAGLLSIGVERGDRVAIVLSNRPEVFSTFVACFWVGAWAMPVMFTLTGEEMGVLFEDARPGVIVTERRFLTKVREGMTRAPSIRTLVTADPDPTPDCVHLPPWWTDMPADPPMADCGPDEVALLMYTSGTTGMPKGVMISHDNLQFTAINSARARGIEPGETFLSCLPLNHSYGIILWASSEAFGVKNVLMPRFDPAELLANIERFKCAATSLVPTMMVRLLSLPESVRHDLSSMKRWGSAAAPLPLTVRNRFVERFEGTVIEAYGLTECSPTVTMNRLGLPYREGSVGTPIEGVEVSIKDSAGAPLPPREPGEICVKGRNVMQGYYNRPEATAEIMREGWLRTGDVGWMDEDGWLYVTDRIKDLIIRGGENIFPADIEEVLMRHPKVMEAAVIGMPDDDYGEVVMAVIVPAAGETPTAREIEDHCHAHLGKFQVPKRIEFVQSLPKTAIGKMLKRELRRTYFGK